MSRTGTYEASIFNWDLGMSKGNDPMLLIEFTCLPPANRPQQAPFDGSTYIVFSDKAMDWAFRKLEAIGYTGTSLDPLNPGDPDAHNFQGTKCRVKVEETQEESYNDPTKLVTRLSCDIVIPTRIKTKIEARDRDRVSEINARLEEYRASREAKAAKMPQEYDFVGGSNGEAPY